LSVKPGLFGAHLIGFLYVLVNQTNNNNVYRRLNMFTYVIGGAVVAALLVAIANYRRDAKGKSTNAQITVDTDEFESTVGDTSNDADAPKAPVTTLTDDNWEELLLKTKSDLPIVIEFHTTWCPGCKAQAPIFARAAAKYATKARFFSADCDEFDHLARVGQVKKIPSTFFILPSTKTQIVNVGLVQLDEFATKLQELAAQAATGTPTEDFEHPFLFS
jgi:thiol-disulfide isomerase/thioredoxin